MVNGVQRKKLLSIKKNNILGNNIYPNISSLKSLFLDFLSLFIKKSIIKKVIESNNKFPYGVKNILKITESEGIIGSCGMLPYLVSIDPFNGSKISVLNNILYLASFGSLPICIVNNLNFGNPNNPNEYWLLEQSIQGITEICKDNEIPIVGGNVSLYNENIEKSGSILPTPSFGVIGKINLNDKIPSSHFIYENESIYLVGTISNNINGSEFSKYINYVNMKHEIPKIPKNYKQILKNVIKCSKFAATISPILEGGIGVTLAFMSLEYGAFIDFSNIINDEFELEKYLFSESPCRLIISTTENNKIEDIFKDIPFFKIGKTTKNKGIKIYFKDKMILNIKHSEIVQLFNKYKNTFIL